MTDPLTEALKTLNNAAYLVLRVGRDTVTYPDLNREALRRIARETDVLLESGGREV